METDSIETDRTSRRQFLATTGAVGAGLLAGCASDDSGGGDGADGGDDSDGSGGADGGDDGMDGDSMDGEESTDGGSDGGMSWRTMELTDVRTEETFTVDGFENPVVIQSFAVWCPKCERQSVALSNIGDSVTVVGLNIDPNEDAEHVRQHAEKNGFDWRFAVAPTEMTQSLVDAFGTTVTNAPSTPVIVACQNGETAFMSGEVNPPEEILDAASEC